MFLGGDGTLTGANLFREEWSSLLQELLDNGKITSEQTDQYAHLNIVGLVILLRQILVLKKLAYF